MAVKCGALGVTSKKLLIDHPREGTGIFRLADRKGRCCWELVWVVCVREYNLTSTDNENVWRSVHAGDLQDVSQVGELDFGEVKDREGKRTSDMDSV